MICIVPDCGKTRRSLGFCGAHYFHAQNGKDLGVAPIRQRRIRGTGNIRDGYLRIFDGRDSRPAHRIIAERVLGRPLKENEDVHHGNGIRADNRHDNLIICDKPYHNLLHQRMRALAACGHADWLKCKLCKQYSPVSDLTVYADKNRKSTIHHPACRAVENKRRWAARKMS